MSHTFTTRFSAHQYLRCGIARSQRKKKREKTDNRRRDVNTKYVCIYYYYYIMLQNKNISFSLRESDRATQLSKFTIYIYIGFTKSLAVHYYFYILYSC